MSELCGRRERVPVTESSLKGKSVSELVRFVYSIVEELESRFEGRRFTPDGHLVGSLGEAIAQDRYELRLLPPSSPIHDARSRSGRLIQIKLTQRRSIGLRSTPDYLIVLQMDRSGTISEVYNGPGGAPWKAAGKLQKNGQRSIGITKLRSLDTLVDESERIPERSP